MEVDHASSIEALVQIFQKQKLALQAASERKGELPNDRKPRETLVREHMRSYIQLKSVYVQRRNMIQQSFVPPSYLPSTEPLQALKKLYIKDLKLETHHRGGCMLLRAVTPPTFMTAAVTIMEDEMNDGVVFQLYQQRNDRFRAAEEILRGDLPRAFSPNRYHDDGFVLKGPADSETFIEQVKGVYIVKEPYYKLMNDGNYGMRVDHVSDIIFLSLVDGRVPSCWQIPISESRKIVNELKQEGNLALKAGRMYEAAELYNRALESLPTAEETRIIKLNRSLANLRLGRYDQALEDAGELTAKFQRSEKGFYRAARALYELGKFQESHDALLSLLAVYPNCNEAKEELSRTKLRLTEQHSGYYDFSLMYEGSKLAPPHLDCATYLGPTEIGPSNGRSRGLFVTRDVKVGELLLCEKAFAHCFANTGEGDSASTIKLLLNTHTDRVFLGTQADLVTEIVQKMYRNPSTISAFTSLHHGEYEPAKETEVDGEPVVDSFLVDRIMSLNVFGCPRTSREAHFDTEQKRKEKSYHTCGFFIRASYINHSCYSNARRSFIGDMQIVRAARDLAAGSEIYFTYAGPNPNHTYEEAQKGLKSWGFSCTCTICEHRKATKNGVTRKRADLLKDLMSAFDDSKNPNLPKAEQILSALEKTYSAPAKTVPRLALWVPYSLLTRCYQMQNRHEKTVQMAWKVLESQGFVIKRENPASTSSPFEIEHWGLMNDFLVETWVHLWVAYAHVARGLCDKVEKCARMAYKLCVGEDVTFDETYGRMAREAMFEGVNLGRAFVAMNV